MLAIATNSNNVILDTSRPPRVTLDPNGREYFEGYPDGHSRMSIVEPGEPWSARPLEGRRSFAWPIAGGDKGAGIGAPQSALERRHVSVYARGVTTAPHNSYVCRSSRLNGHGDGDLGRQRYWSCSNWNMDKSIS